MIRHLRIAFRAILDDLSAMGFRGKTFVILTSAVLIFLLPSYHSRFIYKLVRSTEVAFLYRTLWRNGLDFEFVMKVVFPFVVIIAMRERLRDYGLGLGRIGLGLKLCLLFYLLYIPCFYLMLIDEASRNYYLSATLYTSWGVFLKSEVFSNFVTMLRTEFLYRGFLLFGFRKQLGDFGAVCIATIPYVIVHRGKSEMEALGSFPVGLALSYLALKTGSIWYGILLHWTIAILYLIFIFYIF